MPEETSPSLCLPSFLRRLEDPAIRTVLMCGCGGGFDFVHGMTLYPELMRMGKTVIIGSYSFGDPAQISGDAPTVFRKGEAVVKRVTAASAPDPQYGPEVHICSFLDAQYPTHAPHFAYAYYARAFTVPTLRRLYEQFISDHAIDAVIAVDGGSDSLMAGDEEGLGDPVEDAVSVAAIASLQGPKLKLLISIGLGADRFNHVSDSASLRAIAELTARGGFWGACSLEPDGAGARFYSDCIHYIYENQAFHSVLAGTIVSAIDGHYGGNEVPALLQPRVKKEKLFLWPLMGMLWGFDIQKVAERSMIVDWIRDCQKPVDCQFALHRGREALGARIRTVENLPRHEEMRH